jgi:hypothetical protein
MLLLAGCGWLQQDPDAEAARELQRELVVEAFGGAEVATTTNHISVASSGEAEAGVTVRVAPDIRHPVIVRFAYRDAAPLNLRVNSGDKFEYLSASSESILLLGRGQASEALFYTAGPASFDIEIEDVSECGKDDFVCLKSGDVATTLSGRDLKNRVLIETYNGAQLENVKRRGAEIVRKGDSGEFGAVFTLAPGQGDHNYILEFKVDAPEQVQLRVDRDGQLRYHSATRAWARLNAKTTILLFTADPGRFEIEKLKLVDCETGDWRCKTPEDFDELLPGPLGDTGINRLIAITEWVSRNADYAASESVASDMEITGLTPSQIYYRYFEPSIGGGYCGATATFLARTLRSQGFETFTIDFGLRDDDLTHVTTIVAVGNEFYLMDATFGGYFARPGDARPIDILAVLDGAPYEFRTFSMAEREFIVDKSDRKRFSRMVDMGLLTNCHRSHDAPVTVCNRPDFGLSVYLGNFERQLAKNGLGKTPQTVVELMKRGVFGIAGAADTDGMRRFARALDARGIELVSMPGEASPRRLLAE